MPNGSLQTTPASSETEDERQNARKTAENGDGKGESISAKR